MISSCKISYPLKDATKEVQHNFCNFGMKYIYQGKEQNSVPDQTTNVWLFYDCQFSLIYTLHCCQEIYRQHVYCWMIPWIYSRSSVDIQVPRHTGFLEVMLHYTHHKATGRCNVISCFSHFCNKELMCWRIYTVRVQKSNTN